MLKQYLSNGSIIAQIWHNKNNETSMQQQITKNGIKTSLAPWGKDKKAQLEKDKTQTQTKTATHFCTNANQHTLTQINTNFWTK